MPHIGYKMEIAKIAVQLVEKGLSIRKVAKLLDIGREAIGR